MNIVFLTVASNYHVPLLFARILPELFHDKVSCLISSRYLNCPPWELILRYGWRYSYYKLQERLSYSVRKRLEAIGGTPVRQRMYPGLHQILRDFSIPYRYISCTTAAESTLAEQSPDLLISVYFDQLVPQTTLRLARSGGINLHPSLLPAYAGSSPTFHVLAHGECVTGVTIHALDAKIDAGRILFQEEVPITAQETQFELYRKCTLRFVSPLLECIEVFRRGEAPRAAESRPTLVPSCYNRIDAYEIEAFLNSGRRFI